MIDMKGNTVLQWHLTDWRKSFDASLVAIDAYRTHSDPEMRRLACWLTETSANPYAYLTRSWASAFSSADSFAGLLQTIHHALLDDGAITFVAVNGRPMIVFEDPFEIERVELRNTAEKHLAERRGVERKYEIIEGVQAFIERQDSYEAASAESIRRRQAIADGGAT